MGNIALDNKTTVLSYTNPYLFRSTVQCNVPSEDKSRRSAGRNGSRHVKVKVKQTLYRLGEALRFPGV